MSSENRVLLLGIGNLLWADEGFGVRVVETLNQRFQMPDGVVAVDGGTQGVYLLAYVQWARRMIVFDAIDYGLEPGTLKIVRNEEVPAFLGVKKMSLHQTGFQEVLACAQLTGRYPEELVLIGVQPVELEDFGGSLRPAVKAQIDPAIEIGLDCLAEWGVTLEPRSDDSGALERLSPASVELRPYEEGRPSSEQACRIGDARVLFAAGD